VSARSNRSWHQVGSDRDRVPDRAWGPRERPRTDARVARELPGDIVSLGADPFHETFPHAERFDEDEDSLRRPEGRPAGKRCDEQIPRQVHDSRVDAERRDTGERRAPAGLRPERGRNGRDAQPELRPRRGVGQPTKGLVEARVGVAAIARYTGRSMRPKSRNTSVSVARFCERVSSRRASRSAGGSVPGRGASLMSPPQVARARRATGRGWPTGRPGGVPPETLRSRGAEGEPGGVLDGSRSTAADRS
jgi:hypothetical protein